MTEDESWPAVCLNCAAPLVLGDEGEHDHDGSRHCPGGGLHGASAHAWHAHLTARILAGRELVESDKMTVWVTII